jgi:hypothetical protein
LFNRSSSRAIVIGGDATCAALAVFQHRASQAPHLLHLVVQPFATDSAEATIDGWLGAVAVLAKRAQAAGFRGAYAVALPMSATWLKPMTVPAVPADRRHRIVAFEAGQLLGRPLGGLIWRYQELDTSGAEPEVVVAAVARPLVHDVVKVLHRVGAWPQGLWPASWALIHAVRSLEPVGAPDKVRLLLHADPEGLTLALVDRQQVRLRRVAVARSPAGMVDPSRVGPEVLRFLGHERRRGASSPVESLWCGDDAEPVAAWLRERLPCPVMEWHMEVTAAPDVAAADVRAARSLMPVLVGLCHESRVRPVSRLNLLPRQHRRLHQARRTWPVVAASTALVAAAWHVPVHYFQALERAARHLAAVVEQQEAEECLASESLRVARAELAAAEVEYARLVELRRWRSGWLHLLDQLQTQWRAAEVEGWIDRLQVENSEERRIRTLPAGLTGMGRLLPAANMATESPDDVQRIRLRGRVLSEATAVASPAEDYSRVKRLLDLLAQAPLVTRLEEERFELQPDGLLAFECLLIVRLAGK